MFISNKYEFTIIDSTHIFNCLRNCDIIYDEDGLIYVNFSKNF